MYKPVHIERGVQRLTENYVIEMLHITKEFPGIKANDDITLQLRKGAIHALLGENGAGKSTLMSVLFGLYQPEKGVIKKNGQEVKINNPNDANALGIGMVHQHFKLVECFTVLDNIILGVEDTKHGFLQKDEARKKVMALSEKYGLKVDPDALVSDISVGMQQRVEILKMLYRDNEILIFDEPTAVLTPQEIDELMEIMRGFKAEGKSILFITHKLNEIMAVSDRCSVLRKGKYIGTVDIKDTTKEEINEAMKLAAAEALAMLAREDVPEEVSKAYGGKKFSFGPDYIIPSPLDPRIIEWVPPAVARAAMESGVARARIEDLAAYRAGLRERVARMRRRADAARLANDKSSGRSRCTGRQPPPLFSWPERSGIPDMARHNATRPPEASKPFSLTTDIPLASGERTGHSGAKKEFPHGRHHRQISRRPARGMRAPAERYRARHRRPQGQQRQGRGLLPHRPLRHGPGRLRHDHHRHLRPEPRRGRDRHHHRDQQDHERQPAPHRQDRDHLQHARP